MEFCPQASAYFLHEETKVVINKFSGFLPSKLGRHSRFDSFDLSNNELTGQLPENLCSGGALLGMVAFNNRLKGQS